MDSLNHMILMFMFGAVFGCGVVSVLHNSENGWILIAISFVIYGISRLVV